MTYNVYVQDGEVVFDYDSYPESNPNKYRKHEVGTLSVSLSSDSKITINNPDGSFLYKDVIYTNFRFGIDKTFPSSGSNAKQELEKIFAGQEARKYVLNSSQSDVSFSGDVEYLTFPSSPYGVVRNMLVSESVCIGDSEDSVRGTQNSLELRNLSSGATVSYKIVLSVTNSDSMSTSVTSPSGEFQVSGVQTESGTNIVTHTGTSSVTNKSDWKLYMSLDTEGSGTYRFNTIEITVTK